MYVISEGHCNLVYKDTNKAFNELEFKEDPCKENRKKEIEKLKNPYKKQTSRD